MSWTGVADVDGSVSYGMSAKGRASIYTVYVIDAAASRVSFCNSDTHCREDHSDMSGMGGSSNVVLREKVPGSPDIKHIAKEPVSRITFGSNSLSSLALLQ